MPAYGTNDRFRVDGTVVTLGLLERILANEQDHDSSSIFVLGRSSHDPNDHRDRTNWFPSHIAAQPVVGDARV